MFNIIGVIQFHNICQCVVIFFLKGLPCVLGCHVLSLVTTTAWKAPWDYHFPSPHFHFLSSLFLIFLLVICGRCGWLEGFDLRSISVLSVKAPFTHPHLSLPLTPWYMGRLSFRSFADGSSHLPCCLIIYTAEIHPFPHPPSQSPIFQKLSGISIHVEKSSWLMFYHFDPSCLPSFPPSLYFFSSSLLVLPSLFLLLLFLLLFVYSLPVAHWQILGSGKK